METSDYIYIYACTSSNDIPFHCTILSASGQKPNVKSEQFYQNLL